MKRLVIMMALLTGLSAIAPSYASEKKLSSFYINEGISQYEKGNYIEAILNLRSAEQLSPNPVNVYKYLGMAYSKLSLWRQAAKEFNKILIINPADSERKSILEKVHEWEKQKDVVPYMAKYSFYSIKYKNKIWEEPENLLNYLSLTEIYICSGRYEEAENFFRALVKDRPDKLDFKKYLAEVLFLGGKYSEAGTLYRSILEEEPLDTDSNLTLNLILKNRYEDALAKNPGSVAACLKLARVYRDLKRYEDSVAAYSMCLEKDSANTEVRRELEETKKIFEAMVPKEGFKLPTL